MAIYVFNPGGNPISNAQTPTQLVLFNPGVTTPPSGAYGDFIDVRRFAFNYWGQTADKKTTLTFTNLNRKYKELP